MVSAINDNELVVWWWGARGFDGAATWRGEKDAVRVSDSNAAVRRDKKGASHLVPTHGQLPQVECKRAWATDKRHDRSAESATLSTHTKKLE